MLALIIDETPEPRLAYVNAGLTVVDVYGNGGPHPKFNVIQNAVVIVSMYNEA